MTIEKLDESIFNILMGIDTIVNGGQTVSVETVSGKRTITRANITEMYKLLKLLRKEKEDLKIGGGLQSTKLNASW